MTLNKAITKELKEDILKGNSKYIKNGMIIFDEIVFQETDNGAHIKIYNKGVNLANFHDKCYAPGHNLMFQLIEGLMKVELN